MTNPDNIAPVLAHRTVPATVGVPAHLLPHRTPAQLLAAARQGLAEAANTGSDGLRYAAAHLAALRAAAAMLAGRARPERTRSRRVPSVWVLLPVVAPELGEWATFFANGATKRAAAEAGLPRVVTGREANDLMDVAERFVTLVESMLGCAVTRGPIANGDDQGGASR
jgi:hypothetical protein